VKQVWDLPAARARFGRYLAVDVNGKHAAGGRRAAHLAARKVETEQGELQPGPAGAPALHREPAPRPRSTWATRPLLAQRRGPGALGTLAHEGRAAVVYE
jgi:DNA polymerase-3 subunit alpha